MENKFVKLSAGTLSRKFTAEETIPLEFEVHDCVRVDAVKNEYECFQLVLSAKRDCFFTVEVSPFADGNGNGVKMHSDECITYVDSCLCRNFFNCNGIFHSKVSRSCE